MDPETIKIAGVGLSLIPGLVEFSKKFGVRDAAAEALTVGLGCVFTGTAVAIQSALIPPAAVPYIELGVLGIAGGLSIAGYYKLVKSAGQGLVTGIVKALSK